MQTELKQLEELFMKKVAALSIVSDLEWQLLSIAMETLSAQPTVPNHWNALQALSNFISRITLLAQMGLPLSSSPTVAMELNSLSLNLSRSIIQSLETHSSTLDGATW